MRDVILYSGIGMFVGVAGTGLGGVFASLFRYDGVGFLSKILEFSAGLMIAIVCFDLLPHSFEAAPLYVVLAGVISGASCMALFGHFGRHGSGGVSGNGLAAVGARLAVGVALHNLPEGLAIGSGFQGGGTLGISLAAAILLHNIPEGLALASPFRAVGLSPLRVVAYASLSGVPMGLGALIGALAGGISPLVTALFLSFAGGAMLFLTFDDMIPEAKRGGSGHPAVCLLGILFGILIVRIMG